jgi:hypothetical protein
VSAGPISVIPKPVALLRIPAGTARAALQFGHPVDAVEQLDGAHRQSGLDDFADRRVDGIGIVRQHSRQRRRAFSDPRPFVEQLRGLQ